MFQQTYYIASISEKNPVDIQFIAGLRSTLTHISAAAEGRLEITMKRSIPETEPGRREGQTPAPAVDTLFTACIEDGPQAFAREDFASGQHPRIQTGDRLHLKLAGKAKAVCLALSFAEG